MDKKKKKSNLLSFKKINSLEESEILIKDIFWLFMVVGLILIGIGLLFFFFDKTQLTFGFIGDGFIYTILSLFFYFKKSRIAATVLLIVSAIGVITTTMANFGFYEGGKNIFLAILVFIGGIHSVRATFAYHRLANKKRT